MLWNSIPPSLCSGSSVAHFKKNLKTHLCHKTWQLFGWQILIINITNDLLLLLMLQIFNKLFLYMTVHFFICLIYELILTMLYSALEYCRFGTIEILHYYYYSTTLRNNVYSIHVKRYICIISEGQTLENNSNSVDFIQYTKVSYKVQNKPLDTMDTAYIISISFLSQHIFGLVVSYFCMKHLPN